MNNPKYKIIIGADELFYFHLIARNGEIILASEGYTTQANCHKGIDAVKENAQIDYRYHRKRSTDEQYYFVLVAANGEVIGTSEMYVAEKGCEQGIAAVKETASDAPVDDQA